MDFKELKESLKNAFGSDLTPEQAETLGSLNAKVEELEKEHEKEAKSHEELRIKYINLVKDTSFNGEPKKQDNPQPKTMMECLEEERNKIK